MLGCLKGRRQLVAAAGPAGAAPPPLLGQHRVKERRKLFGISLRALELTGGNLGTALLLNNGILWNFNPVTY